MKTGEQQNSVVVMNRRKEGQVAQNESYRQVTKGTSPKVVTNDKKKYKPSQ